MLPHAPGVQMQSIPEDAVPDDTVDEDVEDPDKRLSSKTDPCSRPPGTIFKFVALLSFFIPCFVADVTSVVTPALPHQSMLCDYSSSHR